MKNLIRPIFIFAFAGSLAACGSNGPLTVSSKAVSVLNALHAQTTIGSTVDTGPGLGNGDQNPYGLAIAPVTSGSLTQGDLVICNFNDAANVQGNGTTIEGLHPVAGSAPFRVAQSSSLMGCDALSLDPAGRIYNAAFVSNMVPIFNGSGTLVSANANAAWSGPFGSIYSATAGPYGSASVFESNANSGTIVRMDLNGGVVSAYDVIATGFTVNTGVPGSISGVSGLTYNPAGDILYVVDGGANRLVAIAGASSVPPGSVTASSARVVHSGAPFNLPVSAALLFNGNIVVGNTGDNNMVEVSPGGTVLGTRNVDPGATGAIFGIVATGTNAANQKIYFNDDNSNSVILISP